MQHYVAETHFLNREASAMAINHHYEQYQLGCLCPEFATLDAIIAKSHSTRHRKTSISIINQNYGIGLHYQESEKPVTVLVIRRNSSKDLILELLSNCTNIYDP